MTGSKFLSAVEELLGNERLYQKAGELKLLIDGGEGIQKAVEAIKNHPGPHLANKRKL